MAVLVFTATACRTKKYFSYFWPLAHPSGPRSRLVITIFRVNPRRPKKGPQYDHDKGKRELVKMSGSRELSAQSQKLFLIFYYLLYSVLLFLFTAHRAGCMHHRHRTPFIHHHRQIQQPISFCLYSSTSVGGRCHIML